MITSLAVMWYVLGIAAEVGLLFMKWKTFLCLPVVGFSIAFLVTRDAMWLWILLIVALGICAAFVVDAVKVRRKPSAEDKSKIKDL